MADWPFVGDGQRFARTNVRGTLSGERCRFTVANTKGTYTQVLAATPFDVEGVILHSLPASFGGNNVEALLDLAIGPLGSEQVIIPNLLQSGVESTTRSFYFPLAIPRNTALSVRMQGTDTDFVLDSILELLAAGFATSPPLSRVAAYGANTTDSGGTQIDPGATANTKGAYAQLTAATSFDSQWLLLALGNGGDFTRASRYWVMDIAVGPAGAEQIIIPDLMASVSGNNTHISPRSMAFPVHIPAGSRLAARAACDSTTANDREFDLVAYCLG